MTPAPRGARLALGTAQLGMRYGIANRHGQPSARSAHAILAGARDAGIEWFDTAPGYGESEAVVGRFLRRTPGAAALRICTKLPALCADLPSTQVWKCASDHLERSRRELGRDTIDLYLLHQPRDLRRHGAALSDCLQDFRRRGWIGQAGASVYAPAEARAAVSGGVGGGIQYPFNLLDRRFVTSGCTATLRRHGTLSFARSPLLQGVLGLPAARLPRRVAGARAYLRTLSAALRPYRLSTAAAAIAFAAQESGADWIVVGAETPEQVDELAQAIRIRLPPELVALFTRRLARVPAGVRDPRRWAAS